MARPVTTLIRGVSSLIRGTGQVWAPDPPYPSLFELGAHGRVLERKGGIYLVWNLGVRPQWLRAGYSEHLASSFAALAALAPVQVRRANGGVFVAWSAAHADHGAGIARYLAERLRPALQRLTVAGERLAVDAAPIAFPLPPGTQDFAMDPS